MILKIWLYFTDIVVCGLLAPSRSNNSLPKTKEFLGELDLKMAFRALLNFRNSNKQV